MQKIDSICRTDGDSNGRCVLRPAFHAVPDGTYDSLAKARSMDRFSGSKRLEGDDK